MIVRPRYRGPTFWDGGKSLDLYFARDKSLDPRITFTRASSGTHFDASGVLQTATTDEPRFDHNPVTGESLGLLIEVAATNLVLNSAAMTTQNVSVSAVAYTLSFYGTGTVTLSGASTAGPLVGSGTKVLSSLTFTPSAGTLTLTVSGSVEYGQLETGSRASSRIITLGSTVTRAADSASMTGTNFSSWFNTVEGTFVLSGGVGAASGISLVAAQNASATNYIEIAWRPDGVTAPMAYVFDGGVSQAALSGLSDGANNYAISYKANDFALSVNGETASTDTSGTVPSVDRLVFYAPYTFKRLTYYPRRLTNGNLQELTS